MQIGMCSSGDHTHLTGLVPRFLARDAQKRDLHGAYLTRRNVREARRTERRANVLLQATLEAEPGSALGGECLRQCAARGIDKPDRLSNGESLSFKTPACRTATIS
jgi:hypothetical protein